MKILILIFLLITGCASNIENRCINAGMKIASLTIEDTGTYTSHAKVQCQKK